MNLSNELVAEIVKLARAHVKTLREDAGYNGEMGDRGASSLESIVNAWVAGFAGGVPKELERFAVIAERQLDPEFEEYERLRKKFGVSNG